MTVDFGGTNFCLAEPGDSGSWVDIGGGLGSGANTDYFHQGTQSQARKIGSAIKGMVYDVGSGNEVDLSASGMHVAVWVACTEPGKMANIDTTGIAIRVCSGSDATSNYRQWSVAGKDTYPGGWQRYVIDISKPPTASAGTLNTSSVRMIGAIINIPGAPGNVPNFYIDRIDYGVSGTYRLHAYSSPAPDWDVLLTTDEGTVANKYGIVESYAGVIYVLGTIEIGKVNIGTTFKDLNRLIVFRNPQYYRDSDFELQNAVADDFNQLITTSGGGIGVTNFQDGEPVGSLDGRAGSIIKVEEGGSLTCDFDMSPQTNQVLKLYGTTFIGVSGGFTFTNDVDHHCYSVSFVQSGQVNPNGAMKFRTCLFSETSDLFEEPCSAAIADDGGSMTDETTAANNATSDDMTLTPSTPAQNDAYYFGLDTQFRCLDLNVSTAGNNLALNWEYWDGDSWELLDDLVDGTNNFEETGRQRVSWTVPTDWATTTVNGQGPFYYIRARLGFIIGATQAKGAQAWPMQGGSALLWHSSIDIQDSSFISNTPGMGHGIEHATAGVYQYNDLWFQGNDKDIHFVAASGDLEIQLIGTADALDYEVEGTGSCTIVGTKPVTITVKDEDGNAIEGAEVYIQKDPQPSYTSDSGNNAGDADFVINETIPADLDDEVWLIIYDSSAARLHSYRSASWSGSTFTLKTQITDNTEKDGNRSTWWSFTGTNEDLSIGANYDERIAQTFKVYDGDLVDNVIFELRKVGTPTGNAYAKLYTTDANGAPDTVLETSTALDVETLGTSYTQTTLQFAETTFLDRHTSYAVSIEFTGGDGSNYIQVHGHSTGNYPNGTEWRYNGSWTEYSTKDLGFEVYVQNFRHVYCTSTNFLTADVEEGDAIRNTTDGSWGLIDEIIDSSHLLVTPLLDGTDNKWQSNDAFSIHRLVTNYEDNNDTVDIPIKVAQTNASGQVTFQYKYISDQNIVVRVRCAEKDTKYQPFDATGTITNTGYSLSVILITDEVNTW